MEMRHAPILLQTSRIAHERCSRTNSTGKANRPSWLAREKYRVVRLEAVAIASCEERAESTLLVLAC
jgi:hypothetical protein